MKEFLLLRRGRRSRYPPSLSSARLTAVAEYSKNGNRLDVHGNKSLRKPSTCAN